MLLWLEFIVCTSVIVYSGTKLSKYGDIIAEKTGLGRTWIGVGSAPFRGNLKPSTVEKLCFEFPDVQCGVCHGLGRDHLTDFSRPMQPVTESVCLKCHAKSQSPDFNYPVYMEKIKHN